jgi:serine/threonine-protein kinase
MATEPSLADLVSRWQELHRQGKPASPEEVCAGCPERVEELKRHLQAVGAMEGFLKAGGSTLEGHAFPPPGAEDPTGDNPEAGSLPREIAGYEILGELGRGGMGVVYKARQTRLNRLVALKMILTGVHAGSEQLARFRAEAQVVARLQHPHIVNIYDVGEHQGLPYLALEYVDGGNLAQLLEGAPQQPIRRAAELTATLAAAVDHAHRRGIVHRDLKPANVLLMADGTPKITDFGLAKQLDAGAARTASGAVLGTPSYMAPEQAGGKGKHIGPATDVYALGAILYELLTGRPPFQAESTLDTLLQVVSEEVVPPTRLRADCPADLEAICLKCLQKDPAQRYSSAAALAEDLQRFLGGEPVQAPRPDKESSASRLPQGWQVVAGTKAGGALVRTARGALWGRMPFRKRWALVGIAGGLFLGLLGGLFLVLMLRPPKPARLIVVGSGYEDNLTLPHNAYGWKGAKDVAAWCSAGGGVSSGVPLTGAGSVRLQGTVPVRITDETNWAPKQWQDFREATLVILVALHGGADKNGAYLFLDDPGGQKRLSLAKMIDDLKPITAKNNVVLILDATQVTAFWPAGMLHNDFAGQLAALETDVKKQPNLVVLSACMPDQRSWVSEEWRRTIFTHYLLQGLKGEAASYAGDTVTVAGLYDYVKGKVERWSQDNRAAQQTPVILPQDGGHAKDMTLLTISREKRESDTEVPPGNNFAAEGSQEREDLKLAWSAYAKLRRERPAVYTPLLWRLYEATLLRYEQLVRAGDREHAQTLKDRLTTLKSNIEDETNPEQPLSSRFRSLAWRLPSDKDAGGAGAGLLAQLRQDEPAERKERWKKAKEQAGSVIDQAALRADLGRQLLDDVARQGTEPKDVMDARQLLLVLDDGSNDRPVEAHLLALLGRDLEERGAARQKLPPAPDLRKALATCHLAEDTALSGAVVFFKGDTASVPAYRALVYPWIGPSVREGDEARRRGENLLFATAEDSWKASGEEFDKAQKAYRAAQDQAKGVRKALAVYHETRAWLPYYAHYLADRAESTDRELEAVKDLADQVDDLAKRLEEPNRQGQSLKDPAEKAQAQLHELQAKFDARSANLAGETSLKGQARWRQLEEVLAVPTIEPAQRLALIKKSRQISQELNERTGQGTPAEAPAADPVRDARRQGRMALAVLGERWVRDCNDKDPATLAELQGEVNDGDAGRLADAGARLGHCWRALAEPIRKAAEPAREDQDPKEAEEDVRRAERLARQLDGGAAYVLGEVEKVADPVAERRRLLLKDLLREMADRALLDHWWSEQDETPYYVKSGHDYLRDAGDRQLNLRHTALAKERGRRIDALAKQLVPAGLDVRAAVARLPVTDETRIDPKFEVFDLPAAKEVPRGEMVYWLDVSGSVVTPGLERRLLKVGKSTIPWPMTWDKGVPPEKPCKVTLHARYRGEEVTREIEVAPAGKPDLTVYQHPVPPSARILLQADEDLYEKLAWEQMSIAIIFDRSFSMEEKIGSKGDQPNPKLPEATGALREVLKNLPPGPKVSLWTFGHRLFRAGEPVEKLRRPKPWTPNQADDLINDVLSVKSLPEAGTPLVRAMMKASEADLGLHRRDRPEQNSGAKLLLVLTDGEDNAFRVDPDYNKAGNKDIPTFLKQQFDDSDIRVFVIGFKVEENERKEAKRQFGGVSDFSRQPGQFIEVEDKEALLKALKKALREVNLATRIRRQGDDTPIPDVEVRRSQQSLIPSQVLKPGNYTVSVPVVKPQEVSLRDGDQLLLKVVRPDRERGHLERALLREYDQLRRQTLARGLPGGRAQDWLVTVHGSQRSPDDPDRLELLISTEKDAERSNVGGVLEQVRPGFVWFDLEPRDGKARPEAVSWRSVGDIEGYPAPMWRLRADGWPPDALPRVRALVCDQDPAKSTALSTTRTHNRGADPETFLGEESLLVSNTPVTVRVRFEKLAVEDRPGHKVVQPRMVVRVTHPPNSPVVARISGGLPVQGQENRIYTGANSYSSVFWGITKQQATEAQFNLSLTSVKAVRGDPNTATVEFNLEEAHRNLQDLPPVGWK